MQLPPPTAFRSLFRKRSFWAGIFFALFLLAATPAAKRILSGKTGDFSHLWKAAQAMLAGGDIYSSGGGYYIYPPLTAFIFQPLALLSERTAALTWLGFNLVLTALAIFTAGKEIARRWSWPPNDSAVPWMIGTFAVLFVIDKIRSIFLLGQIDCFMLLGFVLGLRWMERKPVWAGLAAGAAANVKYLTLIFVPYFLVKRNYRAAFAALLSFAFFMLLPAVQIGLGRAFTYAGTALAGIGKLAGLHFDVAPGKMPDITWERSVSITSALFRLTRSYGFSDAVAGTAAGLLFFALIFGVMLICRGNGVRIFRSTPAAERPETSLEWAVLIMLALAFSPHTTVRQMVPIVFVFSVSIAVFIISTVPREKIALACAIALMVAGLTLPPFGVGLNHAYWAWRSAGGASWCALIFILILAWSGSRAISRTAD